MGRQRAFADPMPFGAFGSRDRRDLGAFVDLAVVWGVGLVGNMGIQGYNIGSYRDNGKENGNYSGLRGVGFRRL